MQVTLESHEPKIVAYVAPEDNISVMVRDQPMMNVSNWGFHLEMSVETARKFATTILTAIPLGGASPVIYNDWPSDLKINLIRTGDDGSVRVETDRGDFTWQPAKSEK